MGSIIQTTDANYSPAKEYGGVWERFAKGRVIVGFNESDADFEYERDAEGNIIYDEYGIPKRKTGGEKTHTLSEREMPNHRHMMPLSDESGATGSGSGISTTAVRQNWQWTASGLGTNFAGGTEAHNNLQPYEVAYIWRRVA